MSSDYTYLPVIYKILIKQFYVTNLCNDYQIYKMNIWTDYINLIYEMLKCAVCSIVLIDRVSELKPGI